MNSLLSAGQFVSNSVISCRVNRVAGSVTSARLSFSLGSVGTPVAMSNGLMAGSFFPLPGVLVIGPENRFDGSGGNALGIGVARQRLNTWFLGSTSSWGAPEVSGCRGVSGIGLLSTIRGSAVEVGGEVIGIESLVVELDANNPGRVFFGIVDNRVGIVEEEGGGGMYLCGLGGLALFRRFASLILRNASSLPNRKIKSYSR